MQQAEMSAHTSKAERAWKNCNYYSTGSRDETRPATDSSENFRKMHAALSNQLPSIAVLEAFDLDDFPPILRMDAGWHD